MSSLLLERVSHMERQMKCLMARQGADGPAPRPPSRFRSRAAGRSRALARSRADWTMVLGTLEHDDETITFRHDDAAVDLANHDAHNILRWVKALLAPGDQIAVTMRLFKDGAVANPMFVGRLHTAVSRQGAIEHKSLGLVELSYPEHRCPTVPDWFVAKNTAPRGGGGGSGRGIWVWFRVACDTRGGATRIWATCASPITSKSLLAKLGAR